MLNVPKGYDKPSNVKKVRKNQKKKKKSGHK